LPEIGRRYPAAGYGGAFIQWLHSHDPQPYNSWGNGSAMRVSPVPHPDKGEGAFTAEPVGDN